MIIFVGSTNPVKLNAVRIAAQGQWPDVEVLGVETKSGVSEQPRTDDETRLGAQNRAKAAFDLGKKQHPHERALLGIGIEGGVQLFDGELWSTVWVVVVDQTQKLFESNGARFKIPNKIAKAILEGGEMGPVMSSLFAGQDIKRKQGAIGVITQNFVDRTEEYASIAKLALGLWFGREWEKELGK